MSDGQEVSISAQNTFTSAQGVSPRGRASVGLSGTWVGIATLQRRFRRSDGTLTSWFDVESWSANIQTSYVADEACELQLGIKTGDYTSGTLEARLGFGG